MMKRRLLPLFAALGVSACFHQVVATGRPPSQTSIDKPWVSGWLWGLVPANEIDVRRECPTGVATVTTEMSFMNGLASFITLGIYTPQHVTITCAGGTASLPANIRELRIPANATVEESAKIFGEAVQLASQNNAPVAIRYEPITSAEDR